MPAPISKVGGQAVIEGVMMRAASGLAVAVRRPSGQIVVKDRYFRSIGERIPIFKLPFLRGIVVLIETLVGGIEALNFSAEQAEATDEEGDKPKSSKSLGIVITLLIAFVFGIGLFVAAPHGLTILVGKLFGGLALTSLWFHLVTGLLKLSIFIGYLGLISLLPDIRRVFQYHGAEHMVIATHEAGEVLEVQNARNHTTFHARCGTSFLLVVVVVAIFTFAVVIPFLPGLGEGAASHLLALGIKIPLLFPIAGLAYEFNRWAADRLGNPLVRALVEPGFLLQRLTTRKPEDDMLEVALSSLKAAQRRDEVGEAGDQISVYRDFAEICSKMV